MFFYMYVVSFLFSGHTIIQNVSYSYNSTHTSHRTQVYCIPQKFARLFSYPRIVLEFLSSISLTVLIDHLWIIHLG